MKIYYAAPLHGKEDQEFNDMNAHKMAMNGHSIYLPQRYGVWEVMVEGRVAAGMPKEKAIEEVRRYLYKMDISAIHQCDCLVMIKPPNRAPSEGMMFELGYAIGIHKDAYIVNHDDWRYNLMPEFGALLSFKSVEAFLGHLQSERFSSIEEW